MRRVRRGIASPCLPAGDGAGRLFARTVEGTAAKAGSGDVPRNDNSAAAVPEPAQGVRGPHQDILAKTVGADPLDIQSTFVGAVCRWQAANPAGLIDITRFWFEQGSLDNERKVADELEVPGREPGDRRRRLDRDAAQRPQRCMRRGQRRGRRGRVGGSIRRQPGIDACGHGDQADGADAGHQRLPQRGTWKSTSAALLERQLVPRPRGAQHRDRRRRELRRDAFGRSLRCCRPERPGRAPPTDIAGSWPTTSRRLPHRAVDAVDLVDHRPWRGVVEAIEVAHRRHDPSARQRLAGAGGRSSTAPRRPRARGAQPVACQPGLPIAARGQRTVVVGHPGRIVRLGVPQQQQGAIAGRSRSHQP